jgi:hypothetical protein
MKKTVKALVFLTITTLFFNPSYAQLKLPVLNGIGNDVKKVIEDYPNRFVHLMGEMVAEHTQSTDYQCNFNVNGAEESIITRYSAKKEVCSWEALMLTTDNFEKAKQKFKSLFSQLNNLSVSAGKSSFRLKGIYESPEEAKKFTSVLFSFDPAKEAIKKLRIEVYLQYTEPMEWKVKVLVYDSEREDNERGKTVEE